MKDYKNVAEDVFRRSSEIIEENKRRKRRLIEIGASAACWAAAGAVGFGVWKASGLKIPNIVISEGQFANDGKDHSGDSDVVLIDPAQGGNDPMPGGVTEPVNGQNGSVGEETSRPASYPELDEKDIDPRCEPIMHVLIPADTDFEPIIIRGRISNIPGCVRETEYSPENGTVVISGSLKTAIDIYGREDKNGEIDYRVIIEYYKDGERIDTTKEIWEFERARDVRLNFQSNGSEWGEHWEHHIWDYMTVNELENFEPSEEYGYVLYLYDVYFGYPYELEDNIINGLYNNGVFFE